MQALVRAVYDSLSCIIVILIFKIPAIGMHQGITHI